MIEPERVSELKDTVGYTDSELRDLRRFYAFLKDVGRELDYSLLERQARRDLSAINSIIDNRETVS